MTQRNSAVSETPLLSPQAADDAIVRALGLFIGQGRRFSCDDIETGTGIPARTVSAWIANAVENRRRPKAQHLLILMHFVGLELTNKLLGPIGQGGRALTPADDDPAMVVARFSAGTAQFAFRAADGVFCHVDRGALEAVADDMILIATPFSSKGRPA